MAAGGARVMQQHDTKAMAQEIAKVREVLDVQLERIGWVLWLLLCGYGAGLVLIGGALLAFLWRREEKRRSGHALLGG